jgi:uncharacterized membrane protein
VVSAAGMADMGRDVGVLLVLLLLLLLLLVVVVVVVVELLRARRLRAQRGLVSGVHVAQWAAAAVAS